MKELILKYLFHKLRLSTFTHDEQSSFEELHKRHLMSTAEDSEMEYNLPYPKYRYLQYLGMQYNYVFHGSNVTTIIEFEPRKQTLFNNKVVEAVFASSEPHWSLFYAVLDRSKVVGNFRNGCLISRQSRYLYYSITEETAELNPWTAGMMYILDKSDFVRADTNSIYFDEWISYESVKPIMKLAIDINDFVLIDHVSHHQTHEPVLKTILKYKTRLTKQGGAK